MMDSSKSILIYIWKNKKDIFSLKNLKSLYSIGHILATIVICILMYVELIAIGTQANKYSVHSLENLIITDIGKIDFAKEGITIVLDDPTNLIIKKSPAFDAKNVLKIESIGE